MYLAQLNQDEKEIFLGLAQVLSKVDNIVSIEENQMMKQYCKEMEIDNKFYSQNVPEMITKVAGYDSKTKKIIILELIGLALCDTKYDIREKEFILNLAEKMNVTNEFIDKCEQLVREYISIQNRINKVVIS